MCQTQQTGTQCVHCFCDDAFLHLPFIHHFLIFYSARHREGPRETDSPLSTGSSIMNGQDLLGTVTA